MTRDPSPRSYLEIRIAASGPTFVGLLILISVW